MARPVWKGSISFGLVNIPVRLFTATESHRLSFHELERGTHARIHHKRVSEATDKEVAWEDIESGYEVRKGHYVVLTDEEMAAAEPRKSHAVEVETFVPLSEIDPINWDQSYYIAPDGPAAGKAYALLLQSMEKKGRVAVGRFVMRTKEYIACVRPLGKVLALHTMFFPDEVRRPADLEIEPSRAQAGKQELALAEKLIDMLSAPWKPEQHKDTFKERVLELVHKKDRGEEITAAAAPESTKVVDLMAALKASLNGSSTKDAEGAKDAGGATTERAKDAVRGKHPERAAASTRSNPRRVPATKRAGRAKTTLPDAATRQKPRASRRSA